MRTFHPITYGIIIGGSLLVASSAIAGGFAIREQSTTGLGKAFADSAAGSDLSSMYWNPAAVTAEDGMNTLSSFSVIVPDVTIAVPGGVGTNIDKVGVLGASYYNYQVNKDLYVGLSINSPLGLVTEADNKNWSGAVLNRKSEILTFNAAPTIGYKITPNLSVAAGLQVEYFKIRLAGANPLAPANDIVVKGDDIGVGFTLGFLYQSEETGTSFGVGFRSSIEHNLDGSVHGNGVVLPAIPGLGFSPDGNITATLDTPEMVTASIRQEVTSALALMANVEWTNWSRLKELRVISNATGTTAVPVGDFSWKDSWLISFGAEYELTEALTVRTGLGFEKTPVPSSTRSARLPDSDRVWLSFGGSYEWSESTKLDIGYSHIFLDDTQLNSGLDAPLANAPVKSSTDIISVGVRMEW